MLFSWLVFLLSVLCSLWLFCFLFVKILQEVPLKFYMCNFVSDSLRQRVPVSIMDLFGNELMKAPENEEDVNELNDVTFGNVSDVCE